MVNKVFIMLPVMFAARKLDGEDPQQVFLLRVAYGIVQAICAGLVIYTYIKASKISSEGKGSIVYVPPPPQVRFVFVFPLIWVLSHAFFAIAFGDQGASMHFFLWNFSFKKFFFFSITQTFVLGTFFNYNFCE